jgi:hypothetical protein
MEAPIVPGRAGRTQRDSRSLAHMGVYLLSISKENYTLIERKSSVPLEDPAPRGDPRRQGRSRSNLLQALDNPPEADRLRRWGAIGFPKG